jgi:hypothetical protein
MVPALFGLLTAGLATGCAGRTASPTPSVDTTQQTDSNQNQNQNPSNVDQGCSPAFPSSTVSIPTASTVVASHQPLACVDDSTAYQPGDYLTLQITTPGPLSAATFLRIRFSAPVTIGQSIPVVVATPTANDPEQIGGTTQVSFDYVPGQDPIDSTPLQAFVVEPEEIPTADGQPLAVQLTMTFADGATLTQEISANSTSEPCPVGAPAPEAADAG